MSANARIACPKCGDEKSVLRGKHIRKLGRCYIVVKLSCTKCDHAWLARFNSKGVRPVPDSDEVISRDVYEKFMQGESSGQRTCIYCTSADLEIPTEFGVMGHYQQGDWTIHWISLQPECMKCGNRFLIRYVRS